LLIFILNKKTFFISSHGSLRRFKEWIKNVSTGGYRHDGDVAHNGDDVKI